MTLLLPSPSGEGSGMRPKGVNMKKIITILSVLLAPLSHFALEKTTGKIDSVTIFTDRALVKRVQPVESTEKTGILRFTALPQSLLSDSVRAGGTGVTVTGVSLRHVEKIYG